MANKVSHYYETQSYHPQGSRDSTLTSIKPNPSNSHSSISQSLPISPHRGSLGLEPKKKPRSQLGQVQHVKQGLDTLLTRDYLEGEGKGFNNSVHEKMFNPEGRVEEWGSSACATYPPKMAPQLEVMDSKPPYESGLGDLEELISPHFEQSAALRKWMEKANEQRKSLRDVEEIHDHLGLLQLNLRIAVESPDTFTQTFAKNKAKEITDMLAPQHRDVVETDRVLLQEIEETYSAFTDVKSYEDRLHARRHAEELLKRSQPPQDSGVTRLLGADGSVSPTSGLSADSFLYFIGSPPTLQKIPFNVAVCTGLEKLGSPEKHLPIPLQHMSPPISLPAAKLPDPDIPDWFRIFENRHGECLEGEEAHTRFRYLLNFIGSLGIEIRESKEQDTTNEKNINMYRNAMDAIMEAMGEIALEDKATVMKAMEKRE